MFKKQRSAALVAEFLGTMALGLLVLSVQRSTIGVPFFVATAAGLTVALMSFAVGGYSGGFFNPAITLAMWTARRLTALAGVAFIIAELLGGWAAYGLFKYFSNTSLQAVGGHYSTRILVAEAAGTIIFAFGFAAAVYQRLARSTTAAYIGLALMIGIVAASTASIGLLNPAVAISVHAWDVWGSMGWGTYVLGPILGAIIGVNFYDLVFAAEGESANWLALSSVKASSSAPAVVADKSRPAKKAPAKKRSASRKK